MTTGGPAQRGWTEARAIYQHVAAVFAAFGLAELVRGLGVDWRGFLGTLVEYWTDTVKPVVEWFFDLAVTTPLRWIGVAFVVPALVRDYLTVGFILGTSFARVGAARRSYGGLFDGPRRRHGLFYLVRNGTMIALTWPLMVVWWFPSLLRREVDVHSWWLLEPEQVALLENHHLIRSPREYRLFIAPLLSLVLLLAINYLVL